jgi:hypothetical protein
MNTNSPMDMRELTGNETALVAGGAVLGAIPGYSAPLPSGLFVNGGMCTWINGSGTCQSNYVGSDGAVY